MEQFEFHHHSAHPLTGQAREWVELEPGIEQATLNEDGSTGRRTCLQRWAPRMANVAQNFAHDYVEEIFLVSGDLADTKRGLSFAQGSYAYRKPGMEHGPFYSEAGCLMFIVIIPAAQEGC